MRRDSRQHQDIIEPREWVGGWLSPALVIGFTLIWSFVIYLLIDDRPRHWQYGVIPFIPGQSAFSIQPQPTGKIPRQVILPTQTTEKPR